MSSIDFLSRDLFVQGVPHEEYRRLRDEAPVSFQTSPGDPGFWILTRHRDVQQALLDAATYSSWLGTTNMLEEAPDRLDVTRMIFINMDPPQHTRYRRLVTKAFAPRAIEALESRMRAMCIEIIEGVLLRGECDFVKDVASRLPMRVIFSLLGVPEDQQQGLVDMSNTMISRAGSDDGLSAAMNMFAYAFQLAAERREHPGDDIVSHLLGAEVDGEMLNDSEFAAFFLLLVVAGNETTRNLISGGLFALLENPDELSRLRADLTLCAPAVEEMLRVVSPIAQFRRTANRDVELHGKSIRQGDKVILAHISANYDERVFAHPHRFDITRSPNPHIAFGYGPHLCLGAALARSEARIMFEELLPRMAHIRRAGPTTRVPSNFVNGLETMPIAWDRS